MAMDPKKLKPGDPPDFSMDGLPPLPEHGKVTKQMWWLICMHERLVPGSKHGGNYVNKPGGHNIGRQLKDYGLNNPKTDHSIRRAPDRTGKWWRDFCAAEDWTFPDADEMQKYAMRLYKSLKDPKDIRGDDVFQYFIGDTDGDPHIEGWHEYNDDDVTGDSSHKWHQHRQYRRNIVGSFLHMWQALTIDMGWTMAEWKQSVKTYEEEQQMPTAEQIADANWNKKFQIPGTTGPEGVRTAGDLLRFLHSSEKTAYRVDELVDEESILAKLDAQSTEVAALREGMASLSEGLTALREAVDALVQRETPGS